MNIGVHVSFQSMVFSEYMPSSVIPESSGNSTFSFWRKLHTVLHRVCECMLSGVQLFGTPWTIACQTPLSMDVFRQEYWSRLPFSSPRDLPDPGIELMSLASPALAGRFLPLSHLGSSCTNLHSHRQCRSVPSSNVFITGANANISAS